MTVVDAPSLFDQLPNDVASRASDPATSKVAAKQKDPRPDQADILRVLRLATVARKVGVRANHRGRPVATWSLTAAGLAAAKALDS